MNEDTFIHSKDYFFLLLTVLSWNVLRELRWKEQLQEMFLVHSFKRKQ